MRATIPYIEQRFEEFNRLCFSGKLPRIPIELSNAKTFIGMCVYKKRRTLFGKMEYYDFRLRINTRIDLPEKEVEDTILHEMIHYYIALNRIPDTSAHGRTFKHLMTTINENFGRNIRVSHRITADQREQAYDNRERYHVIAVVAFTDGRTGFKVLPRVQRSILTYYNRVGQVKNVESVALYMSKNVFFNRYPNSGTLSVHYIDRPVVMQHLEDANEIECDGRTLAVAQ